MSYNILHSHGWDLAELAKECETNEKFSAMGNIVMKSLCITASIVHLLAPHFNQPQRSTGLVIGGIAVLTAIAMANNRFDSAVAKKLKAAMNRTEQEKGMLAVHAIIDQCPLTRELIEYYAS